jgi:hypothetical protein
MKISTQTKYQILKPLMSAYLYSSSSLEVIGDIDIESYMRLSYPITGGMRLGHEQAVELTYRYYEKKHPFSLLCAKVEEGYDSFDGYTEQHIGELIDDEIYSCSIQDMTIPFYCISKYPQFSGALFDSFSFSQKLFPDGTRLVYRIDSLSLLAQLICHDVVSVNPNKVSRFASSETNKHMKLRAFVDSPLFEKSLGFYKDDDEHLTQLVSLYGLLDDSIDVEALKSDPQRVKQWLMLTQEQKYARKITSMAHLINQARTSPGSPFNNMPANTAAMILSLSKDDIESTLSDENLENLAIEALDSNAHTFSE